MMTSLKRGRVAIFCVNSLGQWLELWFCTRLTGSIPSKGTGNFKLCLTLLRLKCCIFYTYFLKLISLGNQSSISEVEFYI